MVGEREFYAEIDRPIAHSVNTALGWFAIIHTGHISPVFGQKYWAFTFLCKADHLIDMW